MSPSATKMCQPPLPVCVVVMLFLLYSKYLLVMCTINSVTPVDSSTRESTVLQIMAVFLNWTTLNYRLIR